MRVLAISLFALTLVACQPQPATPAADLKPVLDSVTALERQVTVLAAEVQVLNGRVVALDDNVRARMSELTQAAADLGAIVQQPIDLGSVDLASIEVLIVTTTADVLDFLVIEPGECPDGLALPRNRVEAGEAVVTVAWPAPAGPHCISYTSEAATFGAVVDVPAGAIGGVTLLAPLE